MNDDQISSRALAVILLIVVSFIVAGAWCIHRLLELYL